MNIEWPPKKTFKLNATTKKLTKGEEESVKVATVKGKNREKNAEQDR